MYFFRTSYAECCLLLELYFPAQISQGQALCGTRTLDSFVPESMFVSSKSAATCVARIATSGNYDESRGVNNMKEIVTYNRAVQYLNKMFKLINTEFFNDELAMPTITVQSTAEAYGHVTVGKVWKNELGNTSHELNISADYLDRPIENVVSTLIHEGCHLYAMEKGIKDTSNRGIYHNKNFKKLAEERGLKIDRHEKYGWTITEPTERIFEFCEKNKFGDIQISRKNQVTLTGIGGTQGTAPKKGTDTLVPTGTKRKSSYQRWTCPCCHTIVRSTKTVNIICGDCGERFVRDEKEGGH